MIPRPEYPKPQFERKNWMNLNGEWAFCFDNGKSGEARKIYESDDAFDRTIMVPFCVESELSGIGCKDFIYGVWYKKTVDIPAEYADKRTVLHIGAADYLTSVYVNGQKAGVHKGGYVSFSFDITPYVKAGENVIVLNCEDDTRDPMIPRGKQCEAYYSCGCDYTRTTGVWQTVWLEFTEKTYIDSVRYYPDYRTATLVISAKLSGTADLCAKAYYEGREVGCASVSQAAGNAELTLSLSETHLWEVGCGRLYDLVLTFGKDEVKSYFGLRNVWMEGYKFMVNGKSVFQRTVLDQGFYPDGIYTAPTDAALLKDIQLSKACGFNGARLHQKVFEERFLYHCDKEGYLVWDEYPNWGLDHTRPESIYSILPEWLDEINRDFNHPAIIGWCPFNETWDQHGCKQYDPLLALVYRATKAADVTRPCIDTSGNYHVETDIFDLHDYEQDPAVYQTRFEKFAKEDELENHCNHRQQYTSGMPVFISEYGGIKWVKDAEKAGVPGWGYGNAPSTEQEYMDRYKGLTDVLLDNPKICGFCYTQLTDIEQEQNGVYTYQREEKFPVSFFYQVNTRKAAIED